jgi:hypothetical protein
MTIRGVDIRLEELTKELGRRLAHQEKAHAEALHKTQKDCEKKVGMPNLIGIEPSSDHCSTALAQTDRHSCAMVLQADEEHCG